MINALRKSPILETSSIQEKNNSVDNTDTQCSQKKSSKTVEATSVDDEGHSDVLVMSSLEDNTVGGNETVSPATVNRLIIIFSMFMS